MSLGKYEPTSIFVSYSHQDERPHPRLQSSRFGELLEELRHELGADGMRKRFTIIKDDGGALRTSDRINVRLSEQMASADIALIFLSENYCLSDSCERELREFVAQSKTLFLVELDDTWSTSDDHLLVPLREELGDLLSIRFWEEVDGKQLRFGHPLPRIAKGRSQDRYQEMLYRLVDDIKSVARDLRKKPNYSVTNESHGFAEPALQFEPFGAADEGNNGPNMVLASSTSDTKALVDRLEGVYRHAGYGVIRLDRVPTPLKATDVQVALAHGSIFVQVIGVLPGRPVPDMDDLPANIAQHRLAAEAGIEIAAWRPHEFDPSECGEQYAAFLRDLATHRTNFEDFEKFTLKLADLKRKEMESRGRTAQIRKQTDLTDPPLVSIDAAYSDRGLRDKIKTALKKYVIVDHIDDQDGSIETLTEAVRDNDAIVLVYGDKIEGQKRAKAHFRIFRRLRREFSEEERQRFEIAFGDAAPETATPCPSGKGIHIIRIRENIDEVSMQSFLAALGVQAEGSRI